MVTGTPNDQGQHGDRKHDLTNAGQAWAERVDQLRTTVDRAAEAVELARRLGEQRAELILPGARGQRPLGERLALHSARFRALVSVTGHVVWSTDVHGCMSDLQPAWMRFTGQTFSQLRAREGRGWIDALHPDDQEEALALLQEALRTEGVFGHTARVQHRRDGGMEWRHMLMRAAPVRDSKGAVIEWVGVNTDVTEFVLARAAAETAERAARQEAEHARDVAEGAWHRAENATKAKGRVLAAASHDLRTPLSAIGGYVDLLKLSVLGPLTTEQAQALERMDIAREHLFTLVGDILDAAQLEAGQSRLQMGSMPLGDVCSRLSVLTSGQAAAKGQRFTCQVVPAADAERVLVRADRDRLQQILVNLVTNAIKFTDASGEVRVEMFASDENAVIQVCDTGLGIAADQLGRVFEPFVQLGRRASDGSARDGSVGLGLATSLELARRMGGDITVESAEGIGSTFTLVLPLAEERQAESGEQDGARDVPQSLG